MSALLDSLCGRERLQEMARNEGVLEIVTYTAPGITVTEVWGVAPATLVERAAQGEST